MQSDQIRMQQLNETKPEMSGEIRLAPARQRTIPYEAIDRHGIVGDRRTAALVTADGTVDWLCLPDFESPSFLGSVLDWFKGGYWRIGPKWMIGGDQSYTEETLVLETAWKVNGAELRLRDAMLWPEKNRPPEQANSRVLIRHMRLNRGSVPCIFDLQPAHNFTEESVSIESHASGFSIAAGDLKLRLWCNRPLQVSGKRIYTEFTMETGHELWAVLELGAVGHSWSLESAGKALDGVEEYWRDWVKKLSYTGDGEVEIKRSAMMVNLLNYAPSGSVVAAVTTSLPERIGGNWNADYRLSWVRDASLSVGMLMHLGNTTETHDYLDWLTQRSARFGRPLQVLYGPRGETKPAQKKIKNACGYRHSAPVQEGNHAYKQHQLGSYGYLADCAWVYLQAGGRWEESYWQLIRRLAAYTIKHWQKPQNGLWELPKRLHYINSKVLSWVTLDRAARIARKVAPDFDPSPWEAEAVRIREEVMVRGWSEPLNAFRQHYEADTLDSSALLISVLEFLPGDHPRVLATIERIEQFLTIDGFVYRFNPLETPGMPQMPMGEMEGAFLPCTFWLATAYAKAGQPGKCEAILQAAEAVAGKTGIFAEAVDPRHRGYLGNTPLLFSHAEYVRAKLELALARGKEAPAPERPVGA